MGQNGNGNGHYKYTVADFEQHIEGSAGIISTIARRVGCAWHTARKFIDGHPTLKRRYDDECNRVLDLAETKVIEAIGDGDMGTTRWYLSTKGKDRGYTERQEHTGAGGGPIQTKAYVTISPDDWDDD